MPFEINEEALKKAMTIDLSKPQEIAAENLPDSWIGTPGRGLPVRQIPHRDFPRVVYLHPLKPTREIENRNEKHELVHLETVPTEHLTRVVQDEAELKAALAEGWVKEPYIPKPIRNPEEDLYPRSAFTADRSAGFVQKSQTVTPGAKQNVQPAD
jgi:hypothetical protein